jgi:hypothetical protein
MSEPVTIASQTSWIDIISALLSHPLLEHPLIVAIVQITFAFLLALFFTERWQRWRQRREFQYRAMVKFGELTEEAFSRLSELLVGRGHLPNEQLNRLRREHIYRRGPLLAMDAELGVAFGDVKLFQGLFYLTDIMRVLLNMACAQQPVPSKEYEPVQECMAKQRKLMITRMAGEMRFLSRRETRVAVRELEPKTKLPSGVNPPKDGEE